MGYFTHSATDAADNNVEKVEYLGDAHHRFASAAAGDIGYDNGTGFTSLAIGAIGAILAVNAAGNAPEWSANLLVTNDGTKTTLATIAGDYWRFGDAGVTGHALASEDDVLVTGKLEVDGAAYFDGGATLGGQLSCNHQNVYEANEFTVGSGSKLIYLRTLGGVNRIDSYDDPITATVPLQINASTHTFQIADATRFALTNTLATWTNVTHSGFKADTIYGASSTYLRVGDAATTSHALASEDDLMVSGKLEVDGQVYLDGGVNVGSTLYLSGNTTFGASALAIQAANIDNAYLSLQARDNGVGEVTLMKLQGAADPYVDFASATMRVYYSGYVQMFDNKPLYFGAGRDFQWYYSSANTRLALRTTDSDGGGTDADLIRIDDGQAQVDFKTAIDDTTGWDIYDDVALMNRSLTLGRMDLQPLIEVGVLKEYEDGWIGHNPWKFDLFLAGGIRQTNQRITELEAEVERLHAELEKRKN